MFRNCTCVVRDSELIWSIPLFFREFPSLQQRVCILYAASFRITGKFNYSIVDTNDTEYSDKLYNMDSYEYIIHR